jgi:3-phosphoshikimate 1-carboxyvinyltransferase
VSVDFIDLPQLLSARGRVRLPGSKSISNRVLLLAALASGAPSCATCCSRTIRRACSTRCRPSASVSSRGRHASASAASPALSGSRGDLFLGNAGTAFRPLTAVLALAGGHYRLSGVPRMHERPIADLVDGVAAAGRRHQLPRQRRLSRPC